MQVATDVLAVLSRAEMNGNALKIAEQLDRNMYQRTNKVLEAAGGKWNRKAGAHLFDDDAFTRIDQIILTGQVEVPKDEFNFFPTPQAVVRRLLEIADVRPGMMLLEPEAGRGDIAIACVDAGAIVDCYKLMQTNFDILASSGRFNSVRHIDFLTATPEPIYDRILMNPPFLKQADIKHVQHALCFLKPDGLLTSVMSAGVSFRDNKLTQDFRDLIRARGGDIEALPEGAFKASGTMVNTIIATIPGAA
ncbi:MAG: Lambda phage type II DNA modification methyltransferase [Rhodocyclaceae bacterium]|nr:MAG: Lambda phage type II DNA modification methyltransferase [Rhodocyclaceae bacterium]